MNKLVLRGGKKLHKDGTTGKGSGGAREGAGRKKKNFDETNLYSFPADQSIVDGFDADTAEYVFNNYIDGQNFPGEVDMEYPQEEDEDGNQNEDYDDQIQEWDIKVQEAFQKSAAKHLKELLEPANLIVNRSEESFLNIVREDSFSTAFDVKEDERFDRINDSTLDLDKRQQYETDMLGASEGDEHAVYGYLRDGPVGSELNMTEQYGAVEIGIKPAVKKRTYFTFGDSFANAWDDGFENLKPKVIPSLVTDPNWRSYQYREKTEAYAPIDIPDLFKMGRISEWPDAYVEAQIMGGVTLDDIDYVDFSDADGAKLGDLKKLESKLKARGIKVYGIR